VLIGLSAVNEWSGAAYLVLGDVSIGAIDLSGDADTRLIGDTSGDWVGGTVAGLGDTNLDDYDDILVGASGADSEEVDVGAAYLLLGAGP